MFPILVPNITMFGIYDIGASNIRKSHYNLSSVLELFWKLDGIASWCFLTHSNVKFQ